MRLPLLVLSSAVLYNGKKLQNCLRFPSKDEYKEVLRVTRLTTP
jgi:hypothetical protein